MRRLLFVTWAVAGPALTATPSLAFHMDFQLVERIGTLDVPLAFSTDFVRGSSHRIRVQFGVFDDAQGPAPAGGFQSWREASISTTGNGIWTRTPGRLAPWTQPGSSSANGVPVTDPFTSLEQIDAGVVRQFIPWVCDANGQPLPAPDPVVRGRNTFVSVFEITVDIPASTAPTTYNFDYAGRTIFVDQWELHPGFSQMPDCVNGVAGTAVWDARPYTVTHTSFNARFMIHVVPAPTAGMGLGLLGLTAFRRQRRAF